MYLQTQAIFIGCFIAGVLSMPGVVVEREPASSSVPAPVASPSCPAQPIQQAANMCTSGSPYCCSGTGSDMVCGPASSTTCSSLTICCINTNGMQICAGEIDFTGPVTININNYQRGKCLNWDKKRPGRGGW